MANPITLVLDANGDVLHSCADAGCPVSWDGYVLRDGYQVEQPDETQPNGVKVTPVKIGDRVPGASEPGDEWIVADTGIAVRRPR